MLPASLLGPRENGLVDGFALRTLAVLFHYHYYHPSGCKEGLNPNRPHIVYIVYLFIFSRDHRVYRVFPPDYTCLHLDPGIVSPGNGSTTLHKVSNEKI